MRLEKIKFFCEFHKYEILIYAVSLLAQLGVYFLLLAKDGGGALFQIIAAGDSDEYIKLGANLYQHRVFSVIQNNGYFIPEGLRPPLYPLFVAGAMSLLNKLWFVMLVQNILVAATPVLLFRFGEFIVKNKNISLAAALLYSLEPERLVSSSQFLSEPLFVLLFLCSLIFFMKFTEGNLDFKNIVLAGFFSALAALSRPVGSTVIFIYLLFLLPRPLNRRLLKKAVFGAFFLIFSFFLVIFPWMMRNKIVFGEFSMPSSAGTLYMENLATYKEHKLKQMGGDSAQTQAVADILNNFTTDSNIDRSMPLMLLIRGEMRNPKYDSYYTREFLSVVKNDPIGYFKIHLYRLIPFFTDASYSIIAAKVISLPAHWAYPYVYFAGRLPWVLLAATIIAGLAAAYYARKFPSRNILFCVIIILFFAGISSMVSGSSRVRQPINPLLILLFSYYCFMFWKFLKHRGEEV